MAARNGRGRNKTPTKGRIQAEVQRILAEQQAEAWRRRKAMAWTVGRWVGRIVAGVLVTVAAAIILYHMGLRP